MTIQSRRLGEEVVFTADSSIRSLVLTLAVVGLCVGACKGVAQLVPLQELMLASRTDFRGCCTAVAWTSACTNLSWGGSALPIETGPRGRSCLAVAMDEQVHSRLADELTGQGLRWLGRVRKRQ